MGREVSTMKKNFYIGFCKRAGLASAAKSMAGSAAEAVKRPVNWYQATKDSAGFKAKKYTGYGLWGAGAAVYGGHKLLSQPTQPVKTANDSSKEKVRKEVKNWENQRKIKNLSLLGGLISTGIALKPKNETWRNLGFAGSMASGYEWGRAKKEEHRSLGRIKKYYDLREEKPFINWGAVLPEKDMQKKAFIGSAIEGVTNLFGHSLNELMPGLPLSIDVLSLPAISRIGVSTIKGIAHQAAQKALGRDVKMSYMGRIGEWAHKHLRQGKNPAVNYMKSYFKPFAEAVESGTGVGKLLKEIEPHFPNQIDTALDLINPTKAKTQEAVQKLLEIKGQYAKAGDEIAKLMPGGVRTSSADALKTVTRHLRPEELANTVQAVKDMRHSADEIAAHIPEFIKREAGKGTGEAFKNMGPEAMKRTAQAVKNLRSQGIDILQGLAGSGILFGTGALAAKAISPKHPLSKEELPIELSKAAQSLLNQV